jgi:hypothetical protein
MNIEIARGEEPARIPETRGTREETKYAGNGWKLSGCIGL